MLNALRLVDGFAGAEFERRTGIDFEAILAAIGAAEQRGLLESDGAGGWRATPLGRRFLNDAIALFLPRAPLRSASRLVRQGANLL
jgi:oxygen-independent coproporphyrinogen-3 oxidase